MALEGDHIIRAVQDEVADYASSRLAMLSAATGNFVIKFVDSQWATAYKSTSPLHISSSPALTWGNATYVTPLTFPLSSALYGRVGLVAPYDPHGWKIFDATRPSAQAAYLAWVKAQPTQFDLLVTTVHSTFANRCLRNLFREQFQIDCVLFHPDQEADLHTDVGQHVWMAVTEWTAGPPGGTRIINAGPGPSGRFSQARFSVLIDEDFALADKDGLPVQTSTRRIESVTENIHPQHGMAVPAARTNPNLATAIVSMYQQQGYVHVYIKP